MDELSPASTKKFNFEIKCIKYTLLTLSILFFIISCVMISGASTLKVIFDEWYDFFWYSEFDTLSSLWLATGCILLILSVFGIISIFKESTVLTNMYGVLLSLLFLLQISTTITAFKLIARISGLLWHSLYILMQDYELYVHSKNGLDWIQSSFKCCGIDGPNDWYTIGPFAETRNSQHRQLPDSCCTPSSSYAYDHMVCSSHFTRGCHSVLNEVLLESIMLTASSALIICFIQILGIICAFMLARTYKQNKTRQYIQTWTTDQDVY